MQELEYESTVVIYIPAIKYTVITKHDTIYQEYKIIKKRKRHNMQYKKMRKYSRVAR